MPTDQKYGKYEMVGGAHPTQCLIIVESLFLVEHFSLP